MHSFRFWWLSLYCLCLCLPARTQSEFDDYKGTSAEDLKKMFEQGRREKDTLLLGKAWYKWSELAFKTNVNSRSGFEGLKFSLNYLSKTTDSQSYYEARYTYAEQSARRGFVDQGLTMLEGVLGYARRHEKTTLEARTLFQLYEIWRKKDDMVKARHYKMQFDACIQRTPNKNLEFSVLLYDIYELQEKGAYERALNLSQRALRFAREINDNRSIALAEYQLGFLHALSGQSDQVLPHLREAEAHCRHTDYGLRRDIYQQMSQTYGAVNKHEQAYFYATRYGRLTDTLLNYTEGLAAVQERVLDYDFDKKKAEIKDLKGATQLAQDRVWRIFGVALWLIVILAVVSGLFYFFSRSYRKRMAREKVIAEQNEILYRNELQRLEDQRQIENMKSMLYGQENERGRVAKDLHDSLGGMLATAKMQLESLRNHIPALNDNPEALRIKGLFDEMSHEARQIAHDLQASTLRKFGLSAALRDLCNRNQVAKMATITFQHFGDFSDFDEKRALQCYRIAQELLQNSVKHAQAKNILVDLTRIEAEIALTVEDDGKGYDPESVKQGMGTDNLASRVLFLGGVMSTDSAPGQGTSTRVVIPVDVIDLLQ